MAIEVGDKNWQLIEFTKCAMSPVYFLNNYGYVYDASKQSIGKMTCFPYQKECIKKFHKFQNNIVLKSRQCLSPDELVDTPGGPVRVSDLRIGDELYSYNLDLGVVEVDHVTDSWNSGKQNCAIVTFSNGEKIEAGENHPFYSTTQEDFIITSELEVGEGVLHYNFETAEQSEVFVESIEFSREIECWDISVKKNENFFVRGVLTHNTGLSVITAAYVAWRLLFSYDEKILIIANDGAGAKRFLATVKQFYEYAPDFLKVNTVLIDNQTKIQLSSKSWVEAKASSPQAGRGESLSLLILDETAFIKDDYAIWMAASIALSVTQGKCIMISTPNGQGNLYHETWKACINNDSTFVMSTVHWTENPFSAKGLIYVDDGHGGETPWSPWYEEQCKNLMYDKVRIAQELDLSFEGSKALAIDNDLVAAYTKMVQGKKPAEYLTYDFLNKGQPGAMSFTSKETTFHVFKRPEEGRSYVLYADVARGDSKDYSTIQVLDAESLEQVAEYRDKIGPDLYPYIIDGVGRIYNDAFVVVEANSFGLGVGYDLRDKMKYPNLFYSKSIQDIHVRPTDFKIAEGTEIVGFQVSRASRPMIVKSLISHMREKTLKLNSPRTAAEFSTFVMKGDKPQAEKGHNDDLIIALAGALYIRDTEYQNIVKTKGIYKEMLGSIFFSSNNKLNVESSGGVRPDGSGENNNVSIFTNYQNGMASDPMDDEDLSWLYK